MGLGKKTIDDQNYCGKKVLYFSMNQPRSLRHTGPWSGQIYLI